MTSVDRNDLIRRIGNVLAQTIGLSGEQLLRNHNATAAHDLRRRLMVGLSLEATGLRPPALAYTLGMANDTVYRIRRAMPELLRDSYEARILVAVVLQWIPELQLPSDWPTCSLSEPRPPEWTPERIRVRRDQIWTAMARNLELPLSFLQKRRGGSSELRWIALTLLYLDAAPIRLQDLADVLGVTRKTLSRALLRAPDVLRASRFLNNATRRVAAELDISIPAEWL